MSRLLLLFLHITATGRETCSGKWQYVCCFDVFHILFKFVTQCLLLLLSDFHLNAQTVPAEVFAEE